LDNALKSLPPYQLWEYIFGVEGSGFFQYVCVQWVQIRSGVFDDKISVDAVNAFCGLRPTGTYVDPTLSPEVLTNLVGYVMGHRDHLVMICDNLFVEITGLGKTDVSALGTICDLIGKILGAGGM